MKTSQFDYTLPKELIAFHPPERRDGGRLLVLDPARRRNEHVSILDLPRWLPEGALLVANDTRVIKARLMARKPTGGAVELLFTRPRRADAHGCRWSALARSSKSLKIGDRIVIGAFSATVCERGGRGEVTLDIDATAEELDAHLDEYGLVPLPPYIKRAAEEDDVERYQTVYAKHRGSVAAPTAGLHFTDELIDSLVQRGIEMAYLTLHVGPGTFRPVTAEEVLEHKMDEEPYVLGRETVELIEQAKRDHRPVVAVGTTVTRALEGAVATHGELVAGQGATDLFITPGFEFKIVDGLLTNFHLPRSTLLCLVSALAGRERILEAYGEAVAVRYRFYSYGDAMLILPGTR